MIIFVIFNTISKYDFLFQLCCKHIALTLYLIHKVSKKYNYEYANNLIISSIGAGEMLDFQKYGVMNIQNMDM